MIRRLVRRWSTLAVAAWAWNHRGTVVRLADLAKEVPDQARSDKRSDLLTQLKAIHRLDRDADLARRTDLRIGSVDDGVVTLVAPEGATDLAQARRIVSDVSGVESVHAASPVVPVEGAGTPRISA